MALDRSYPLPVPEVGDFTMRRRRIADQVRIEAEAQRMLGGPTDDPDLERVAMVTATIQALTVRAPDGFSIDAIDPLDADDMNKLWAVWRALRAAEEDFRKKP